MRYDAALMHERVLVALALALTVTVTMPCREGLELPVLSERMRRRVGRFGWRWAGREG